MANTPNYNLLKPSPTGSEDVHQSLSDNFTIIDTQIKANDTKAQSVKDEVVKARTTPDGAVQEDLQAAIRWVYDRAKEETIGTELTPLVGVSPLGAKFEITFADNGDITTTSTTKLQRELVGVSPNGTRYEITFEEDGDIVATATTKTVSSPLIGASPSGQRYEISFENDGDLVTSASESPIYDMTTTEVRAARTNATNETSASLKARLDGMDSDIATNTTDIQANSDQIGNLTQSVTTNTNSVGTLKELAVSFKDSQYGVKGDTVLDVNGNIVSGTDDSAAIASVVAAINNGTIKTLRIPSGIYRASGTFQITKSNVKIICDEGVTFVSPTQAADTPLFQISGTWTATRTTATASITKGDTVITVANASYFSAGSYIIIRSDTEVFNPDRSYMKAEHAIVKSVNTSTNQLTLMSGTYDSYSTTGATVKVDLVVPIKNISISGLGIRMGGDLLHQGGILIENADGVYLDRMSIEKTEAYGIRVNRSWNVHTEKSYFTGCTETTGSARGYGIWYYGVEGGTITRCKGYANRHSIEIGGDGTYCTGRNIVVSHNNTQYDIASGISSHGGCELITFNDNTIHHCGGGIVARGGSHTIENNKITGKNSNSASYKNGIHLGDDGSWTWGNGLAGTNLILKNNTVIDVEGEGVYSTAPLVNALIEGNTFKGFKEHGMEFKGDYLDTAEITNNVIDCGSQNGTWGNSWYGIWIYSANAGTNKNQKRLTIRNNRIPAAKYSAIRIEGCTDVTTPSEEIRLERNTINTAGTRGIDLINGYFKDLWVERNKIYRNNMSASGSSFAKAMVIPGFANMVGIYSVEKNDLQEEGSSVVPQVSTATITSGTTSIVVNHKCYVTPNIVFLTAQGNVGNMWASGFSSSQFTINCATAPGSNTVVAYEVSIKKNT